MLALKHIEAFVERHTHKRAQPASAASCQTENCLASNSEVTHTRS